ncbi:hypothetical protein BCR32DRAFT_329169 [Anaeromyces robustus]|uniref:Phosphoglycerate mutase-like protein n=1 Tax=Anaeromyces robustus TaxID=1754192 RepID=A0A1Y1WTJ1_9FUNG|nr:hypothetical protein BCR32DRAFT_329169 [Anaeromyces robustus]|eukprot:ORX76861.1 hypothetical protein BCR32DRAFT_329169 [Anaeromyces robustus]
MKLFLFITLITSYLFSVIDARRLIIIRHGEKVSEDYKTLSNEGTARANCLYQIFNDQTIYGEPGSIYANHKGTRSHRPYDTVKPLADLYNLEVQQFHKYDPEVRDFVKDTLNQDKSEIILISSAKEWIPLLLDAIGGYKLDTTDKEHFNEEGELHGFNNIIVIENDDTKGNGILRIDEQHIENCMNDYLENLEEDVVQVPIDD